MIDLSKYNEKDLGLTKKEFTDWLEKLRSGKYKQGEGLLKYESEIEDEPCNYCCLGVLGEVLAEEGKGCYEPDSYFYYFEPIEISEEREETFLPSSFMSRDLQDLLAFYNDGGASFTEIADALEKYFNTDLLTKES